MTQLHDANELSYSTEFLEGNLSVSVGVGVDDGLVDYLLQLRVFEVVADHHFQYLKQLAVRDEPVAVHVVDLEGNCCKHHKTRQCDVAYSWAQWRNNRACKACSARGPNAVGGGGQNLPDAVFLVFLGKRGPFWCPFGILARGPTATLLRHCLG